MISFLIGSIDADIHIVSWSSVCAVYLYSLIGMLGPNWTVVKESSRGKASEKKENAEINNLLT